MKESTKSPETATIDSENLGETSFFEDDYLGTIETMEVNLCFDSFDPVDSRIIDFINEVRREGYRRTQYPTLISTDEAAKMALFHAANRYNKMKEEYFKFQLVAPMGS